MIPAQRARLLGPRDLVFEDIEVPEDCGEYGLLVETEQSAVSLGTEVAAYRGDPPLGPGNFYPRLVGYCNVGTVRKVGSLVKDIAVGQRVLTHQAHQSAYNCDANEVLAALIDDISTDDASVAYLAQLGLAALQKAGFEKEDIVIVIGLGFIGLATVALVTALGGQAIAIGNHSFRLDLARQLGAKAAFNVAAPNLRPQVTTATGGKGADIIVSTVNPWSAWQLVLDLARFQSRIAVLGFPGRNEGAPSFNPLSSASFYSKQLTIVAAGMLEDSDGLLVSPRLRENMSIVLQLIGEGLLNFSSLITHRVPWSHLSSVYEQAAGGDKSLVGAVLQWRKE